MPLFTVLRHFPGATSTDLDAASFRSLSCLMYHPGLAWRRSYWDPAKESTICIYEAADAEQIRLHAVRASLPCDEISRVEEVDPAQYLSNPRPDAANATSLTDSR